MGIFLAWIIFSIVAGAVGSNRKIGFAGAFFLSLFLSPLVGLIVAFASKRKDTEEFEKSVINSQKLESKGHWEKENSSNSISEELERISKLREANHISEEEYQILKEKIING